MEGCKTWQISLSWIQEKKPRNVSCSWSVCVDPLISRNYPAPEKFCIQHCFDLAVQIAKDKNIGDPICRDPGTKLSLYIT